MDALYTANVTARGGRQGSIKSDDGTLQHELSMPQGLGGSGGSGTNPEQLFAAGYAACFNGALALVARKENIPADESTVTAHVSIGKESENLQLAVRLDIRFPGVDHAKAQELVRKAHQVCPYSRATRGNIDVQLNVLGADADQGAEAGTPSATAESWGR